MLAQKKTDKVFKGYFQNNRCSIRKIPLKGKNGYSRIISVSFFETGRGLYRVFNEFELEDLEETVLKRIWIERLHKAIEELPEIQKRRNVSENHENDIPMQRGVCQEFVKTAGLEVWSVKEGGAEI